MGTEHYAFPAEYRVGRWVVATKEISSRIPTGAGGYIVHRSHKHGEDYIEVQFIGSPEHRVTVTASSQKRIGYVKLVEATGQSKFKVGDWPAPEKPPVGAWVRAKTSFGSDGGPVDAGHGGYVISNDGPVVVLLVGRREIWMTPASFRKYFRVATNEAEATGQSKFKVGDWVRSKRAISATISAEVYRRRLVPLPEPGTGGYVTAIELGPFGSELVTVAFVGRKWKMSFDVDEVDDYIEHAVDEAVTVRIPHTQVVHHTNPSKLASACRKSALAWKDHTCAAAYISKFGKVVLAYSADGELVAGWNPVSRKWIHAVSNKPIIYKTVKERADKVLPQVTS